MANSPLKAYDPNFIEPFTIPMPGIADDQAIPLSYINYSVLMSAERGFPYYTASNIDGSLFKKAPRKDNWRRDERLDANLQWGPELYKAAMSDFDKGHMVKREDVQWGESVAMASKAANATFFYTNAVPQHANLNQQVWRSLEDYILHTEAKDNGLKIAVFTGPVLHEKDPLFVTEVRGKQVQIPTLFWKVVLFKKNDGKLYRVGFMMSQASLLRNNGIVKESTLEKISVTGDLFNEFDQADTYQVNIATIEKLTGLTIPPAKESYTDNRKIKLILQEIDVQESLLENANKYAQVGFKIGGLQL